MEKNKRFSDVEKSKIRSLINGGHNYSEVANNICRSEAGVRMWAKRVGIGTGRLRTRAAIRREVETDLSDLTRDELLEHIVEIIVTIRGDDDTEFTAHFPDSLKLTRIQKSVLYALYSAAGRCVSRDQIMAAAYAAYDAPDEKIIDVSICKIRKKIGQTAWKIVTIWGQGYKLERRHVVE